MSNAPFFEELSSTKGNDPAKPIITAALTGVLTTRDQCPALPYTPEEIAEEAAAAREAGAAIAHIHARTDDGSPTFSTDIYREIHDEVRDRTDILLDFSTGSLETPLAEIVDYLETVQPDIAPVNMGTMNYAKYSESREEFVFDLGFENPLEEIQELVSVMNEAGIQPQLDCHDVSQVGNMRPLSHQGLLDDAPLCNLILGVLGGTPATTENLTHLVRQLPESAVWQVVGVSRAQWPLVAGALSMGGSIRVGLEDNFYLPNGEMAESNAELVEAAVELCESVGREPATPAEAREIIGI